MHEVTHRLFVGVDWGTEIHQVCVLNPDGQIIEERKVAHSATSVAEFLDWLLTIAPQPESALEKLYNTASFAPSVWLKDWSTLPHL